MGEIKQTVNGLSTLSGGTRMSVKTVRPWQVRLTLPANRADCQLCSLELTDEYVPAPGWKTFQNSNTPWPYHRLLIPTDCWPIDKLWSLGGPEMLAKMLRLAIEEVLRTRQCLYPIWIFIHIGFGAGQNFAHPHWHICLPPTVPEKLRKGECVTLSSDTFFEIVLGGVRAGQSFIFPKTRGQPYVLSEELAYASSELIEKFNKKFDRPDYCYFLALNSEKEWWARYTPILNNWGGSEFMALDIGTPFVLPWPHEATRDFLLAP